MPKRQNDYSPGQYRLLTKIKELLVPYEAIFDIMVDQKDSYYLAFPHKKKYGKEQGNLFAAVQIMDITIDLFIGALMSNRESFNTSLLKEIEGIIDGKGVLHIHFLSRSLKEALQLIFAQIVAAFPAK